MTFDSSEIWHQTYLVFGLGPGPSALIAAIPVFTLVYVLAVRRKPAWIVGITALGVTLAVATAAYRMPFLTAVSAVADGAAFGLFPISWIVFWAIALYGVSVETGKFEIIKHSIGALTRDRRLQALLIGFAFGTFLEGAAGFGTPVAVAAAMWSGLGFTLFEAAAACLLANTAPVAFGPIGIPVITLAGITGLPLQSLSAAVGRICAPVPLLIPAYLTVATGGFAALREVWPAATLTGISFADVQFLASNYLDPQLTDILASMSAMVCLRTLIRWWKPSKALHTDRSILVEAVAYGGSSRSPVVYVSRSTRIDLWAPDLTAVATFSQRGCRISS